MTSLANPSVDASSLAWSTFARSFAKRSGVTRKLVGISGSHSPDSIYPASAGAQRKIRAIPYRQLAYIQVKWVELTMSVVTCSEVLSLLARYITDKRHSIGCLMIS
jgi:hypothetical protein